MTEEQQPGEGERDELDETEGQGDNSERDEFEDLSPSEQEAEDVRGGRGKRGFDQP